MKSFDVTPIAVVRANAPLAELASSINQAHEQLETDLRSGLDQARRAGQLLRAAKKQLAHGGWLAWLKANVSFAERTAQNYIRIARRWDELLASNPQRVADLPYRDAIDLLTDRRLTEEDSEATQANNRGRKKKPEKPTPGSPGEENLPPDSRERLVKGDQEVTAIVGDSVDSRNTSTSRSPLQGESLPRTEGTTESDQRVDNTPLVQEPSAKVGKDVTVSVSDCVQQHPAQQTLSSDNANDSQEDDAGSSTVNEAKDRPGQTQPDAQEISSLTAKNEPASTPPSTPLAATAPVTTSTPTKKLQKGQWKELLDHLTKELRPIADEKGRLYSVKAEDCDVALIRELVAKVRRWATYADGVISAQ